ncbi:MAG TPA: hypothetical protein PLI22_05970 [Caldisericia bacterium]|nr:hypothetical protein [Caldisericia bacterium]
MKKLSDYKDYKGVDGSLEVSLFDYGLIWHKNKYCKSDEYYFIYDTHTTDNEGNKLFGSAYLSKQDLLSMFDDWAEKSTIESFTGQPFDTWIESFPCCVYDMVQYYGTDDVFGTDYNPQPIKE